MILLVTGGCGFIGSNFVRFQRAQHPDDRLVVLDALTYAGNLHNLDGVLDASAADPAAVTLVRGDIADAALVEQVLRDHQVEAIIHFAAESHVDRSILGPGEFVRTNVLGTATLLEQARAAKVARFLHVSTDEVYGDLGPADPPFTEQTPLAPRSPYSASKASSDHLVAAWHHTWHFPSLITRCSNNYGPYQFPEKLIPLMILRALDDQPLPVYGDGMNVRDWIHVEDHCAALDAVLRRGREGEVYNIGGNSERANLAIVRRILELCGKSEALIRHVTDRPGHDRRYALSIEKIERELGWTPRRTLDEGLAATVAWYRANEPWWRTILSGDYRTWYERNYHARKAVHS
ncbi:MAG: dTDP-glucose 4,6-dehydratase [Myxococcales bacterium]|nr:dTDP-glucose 4,6-dehydratase [Myxococcales bacterium]